MKIRPENLVLSDSGRSFRIDFRYGVDRSATASNGGIICLIPIPKGYTEAYVTVICEEA